MRNLLKLLDVRPGQRVLDVGCGSAWTTALLAHLVGPDGEVIGVEIVPGLVRFGRSRLGERANARVTQALPGVLGLPEGAPYDRILVSAEARTLPVPLVDQLTDDGVLVVPVDGTLLEVRPGPEVIERGRYAFVPLVGG